MAYVVRPINAGVNRKHVLLVALLAGLVLGGVGLAVDFTGYWNCDTWLQSCTVPTIWFAVVRSTVAPRNRVRRKYTLDQRVLMCRSHCFVGTRVVRLVPSLDAVESQP